MRLLSILKKLTTHKKVCVKELAIYYDVSIKSIQNDFEVLNKYFGDKFNKIGDCYLLLKQEQFYNLFQYNHKTSKQFLKFLSMIDSDLYSQFKKENNELIKALKLDSSSIYQIENSPYEKLKSESLELLEELELAVINRYYLTIIHQKANEEKWLFKECQVLKILYLEDNWYIAVNTLQNYHTQNSNSCFRLMRISFIKKIRKYQVEHKTFHNNHIEVIKAQNSLKYLQTPFSKIHNKPYQVMVEISAFASVYFRAKQYLKYQREVKTLDNGAVLFEFTVTDDMEIIPLIQQWIPHLKVMEPLRIKEKIVKSMKQFMKGE